MDKLDWVGCLAVMSFTWLVLELLSTVISFSFWAVASTCVATGTSSSLLCRLTGSISSLGDNKGSLTDS